jgi:two-component system nitrogen regulation response regulator GlnG
MPRLLLVDDDPILLLDQIRHVFGPHGLEVVVARSGQEGLEQIAMHPPDVVLLDVSMPDLPGLEVFRRLRRINARVPVIFVTATSRADTAIEAMKLGAYDYLFKPVDLAQLQRIVGESVEIGRRLGDAAGAGEALPEDDPTDSIIGRSPAMREVFKAIGRVADQNVIVLIGGESGTGKELVARAIFQHSGRAQAPFLSINCAAIPEGLLESELFGHERGAFTGADRRRIGKFEQCNGGTIVLDEVGDMPFATQGKILRLLQDQTFERVGGHETIHTDVRLIAATNRDLRTLAESGKFRPDLYYRLSVFGIHLPPLRERGEDLLMLVRFFVRQFSRELGRRVRDVAPESLRRLSSYAWPGNVRELQSVLKQSLLRTHGSVLTPEFLPEFLHPSDDAASLVSSPGMLGAGPADGAGGRPEFDFEAFIRRRLAAGTAALHAEAHLELDRVLLTRVLTFANGSQYRAAKLLGIARQTLRNRLRELHLNVTKTFETDEGEMN